MMDDPQMISSLIQNFGTPTAIVGFFLWWAFKREMRLSERMEKLDDYQRIELATLIRETTKVISDFVAVVRERGCTESTEKK